MLPNATKLTDQYSIRVKNGAGWRDYECCRLVISVGQSYHESDKLAAMVDWLNRSQFLGCEISVNDTLQRYNFIAQGAREEDAHARSRQMGETWLSRNGPILSRINCPMHVVRWDEWLGDEHYKNMKVDIDAMIARDGRLRDCVAQDVAAFIGRQEKKGRLLASREQQTLFGTQYIAEELAAFALMSERYEAAEIYPGSNLKSAEYFTTLNDDQCPPALTGLKNRYFTRVDFARLSTHVSHASHKSDPAAPACGKKWRREALMMGDDPVIGAARKNLSQVRMTCQPTTAAHLR